MTLSSLLPTLLVGLAGAFGALSRYLLSRFVTLHTSSLFPLGTLLINITGAFFIGLLFSLTSRKLINPDVQLTLATGFLGGYTTFSTMSWETVQLVRGGKAGMSFLYLEGSYVLGLLAVALGLLLGGLL